VRQHARVTLCEEEETKTFACWLQHFGDMDRLYEAACEVESAIEECIGAEQYVEASRLRGVHADIQERDDVHNVLDVSSQVRCRLPLLLI